MQEQGEKKEPLCQYSSQLCREPLGIQEGGRGRGTKEFPGEPQCGSFAFQLDSAITQKTVRLTPIAS